MTGFNISHLMCIIFDSAVGAVKLWHFTTGNCVGQEKQDKAQSTTVSLYDWRSHPYPGSIPDTGARIFKFQQTFKKQYLTALVLLSIELSGY